MRQALVQPGDYRVDALIGYRFSRLDDRLSIGQGTQWVVDEGLIPAGTVKKLSDQFTTGSEFHGADLGVSTYLHYDRWSLELLVKLGLGNTRSTVRIDGATVTTLPGTAPATTAGGLLAQGTNIGSYSQNQFSIIPEAGITLGCDVTDRLRATFGYTFLYWANVVRPGDQIDFSINPSQFPPGPLVGAPRPEFNFATTGFWAQGMNFGLEYSF